jgi:hypothetical protein
LLPAAASRFAISTKSANGRPTCRGVCHRERARQESQNSPFQKMPNFVSTTLCIMSLTNAHCWCHTEQIPCSSSSQWTLVCRIAQRTDRWPDAKVWSACVFVEREPSCSFLRVVNDFFERELHSCGVGLTGIELLESLFRNFSVANFSQLLVHLRPREPLRHGRSFLRGRPSHKHSRICSLTSQK